jgi:4-hydroxybenzoate polyprenyltransferase
VYDVEEDRLFRPDRPLPSGRIPLGRAQKIGYGLLVIGLVAGWLAGYVLPQEGVPTWRSGAIVTGLAACVWLYDAMLKATPAGPILMGACRLLNVLLGMSVAAPYVDSWNVFGYGLHHGIVAGGIGLYITGVAWFARGEAETSSRGQLLLATLVMVTGIGVLGTLHRCLPLGVPRGMQSEGYWLLLLALLAFTIVRRCIVAVVEPEPALVQAAVKHGILSLIVLDAAVTVEVSSWYYAFWLLMLLIPSTLLGKWVYST